MTSWKWWGLWIPRRSHGGVRVPGRVFVCGTLCPWQYQNNTFLNTTQHSRAPSGIGSEAGEVQPLIIPNVKSDNHSAREPYNICKPLGRWNVTYRHFSAKSYSPGNFPYDKNSLISDDGMLRFTGYRFIVKNLLKFLSWSPTWGFKSYLKKDQVLERRKWIDTLFYSDCKTVSFTAERRRDESPQRADFIIKSHKSIPEPSLSVEIESQSTMGRARTSVSSEKWTGLLLGTL